MSTIKVSTDGKPNVALSQNELSYDVVGGEVYLGSGSGTADGTKLAKDAGEIRLTRNTEVTELTGKITELSKTDKLAVSLSSATDAGYPEYKVKSKNFAFGDVANTIHEMGQTKMVNGEMYKQGESLYDYKTDTLTNYQASRGSVTFEGGNIIVDSTTGDGDVYVAYAVNLAAGNHYTLSFNIDNPDIASGRVYIKDSQNGNISDTIMPVVGGKVTFSLALNADAVTILFQAVVAQGKYVISNLALEESVSISLPEAPEPIVVNSLVNSEARSKGDMLVLDRPELVTNGDFSNGTTGWAFDPAFWSFANGKASVTATSQFKPLRQVMNFTSNQKYVVTFTISNLLNGKCKVEYKEGGASKTTPFSTNGVKTIAFTTVGSMDLDFARETSTCTFTVSDISIKQVNEIYLATEDTADMFDIGIIPGVTTAFTTGTIYRAIGFSNVTDDTMFKYVAGPVTTTLPVNYEFGLDDVGAWLELGTASGMSLLNPYFKVLDKVFVNDVVVNRVSKTTDVLDIHAFRSIHTYGRDDSNYDIMVKEGFGLVQGMEDTFEDADYFYSLVGYVPRLNKGAYHPVHNPMGSRGRTNVANSGWVRWYVTDQPKDSVADVFSITGGRWALQHEDMVLGSNTRPDSRWYFKIYEKGLNALVDRRMDTKVYSKAEMLENSVELLKELREDYGAGMVDTITVTVTPPSVQFPRLLVYVSSRRNIEIGDMVLGSRVVVISTNAYGPYVYLEPGFHAWATTLSVGTHVGITRQSNVSTQGEQFVTDLTGDPSNYPQMIKDRLASGGSVLMSPLLVPVDGTTSLFSMSSKVKKDLGVVFTGNLGVTWVSSSLSINLTTNKSTTGLLYSSLNGLSCYVADIDPVHKDVTRTLVHIDDKVYASNNHSIHRLGDYTRAITGKVPVASGRGEGKTSVEQKNLEGITGGGYDYLTVAGMETVLAASETRFKLGADYVGDRFKVGDIVWYTAGDLTSWLVTYSSIDNGTSNWKLAPAEAATHSDIGLNNSDSPAAKFYKGIAQEGGQAMLQVEGREMVWDSPSGDAHTFEDRTSAANTLPVLNRLYHVTNGRFEGYYLCVRPTTTSLSSVDWYRNGDGDIVWKSGYTYWKVWDGNGFGDNNKFDSTTIDVNGKAIVSGSFSARLPYRIKG